MSRARQLLLLYLCGVAALVLAVIVFVLNRGVATDLLAAVGIIGGLAIVIGALPTRNGG
jgi:glucose uptake protein GlcU